jgi:lysozyme
MDLKKRLIQDEGLRLEMYRDTVGVWTIGVGRAIGRRGITEAEALYLLENDIVRVTAELTAALPYFVRLSAPRQHVLINMAFNLGTKGLLRFRATLAHIAAGRYAEAAAAMLQSKWAHQVGARAQRLARTMSTNQE